MHSQQVVLALVVLCGALSVNGSAATNYIQSIADQSFMKLMMQSRAVGITEKNECFNHYTPVINEIIDTYKTDYNGCLKTQQEQIAAINDLGSEARKNITENSNHVCSQFQECQNDSDNLVFFDCYTNLGAESVSTIYSASQNASVAATNYREAYHTIQVQSEVCVNETERTYVTESANAFGSLNDCLDNGINWTEAPATEAPATEAPATEAPATEAPATEAPATEAPATEAPATEAPATEAPATEAPATEAPATEAPATEAPATEAPATEAPATEAPATEAPATEAPATEAPATEAPATEAPATEAPATEAPGTTEADQVEELSQNVRSRLQKLVSSWGKRFA